MAEAAHRRLVRHRLAAQIDADKTAHRRRIVERLLHRRVRQVEPLLQEVDAQHPLGPNRRAAIARLGIDRLDQPAQLRPRNHPLHLGQKNRPPRPLGVALKPHHCQCQLLHSPPRQALYHGHCSWLLQSFLNAAATLNLLEATRQFCSDACFIFTSTNKVYGDTPNRLPLVEQETRWELPEDHPYGRHGIDESMSIDQTMHSLFGASKVAADVLVQEYGRYFGMKTVCFSRRLSHRSQSFRGGAPWFSSLSCEVRGHRPAICRVRLRREAGSRQHSFF